METKSYDVVIIGGGISGTALLYLLSRYTDVKSIALIEKLDGIAVLNSHGRNNSQTLHCGDIETNYTLDKAVKVKTSANMVVNYATELAGSKHILYKYPKMVLGVGEKECDFLEKRYAEFSPHYDTMQLWDADGISKIEPNVAWGRQERIAALGVTDEYSAVNFQALSESFVTQARQTDKQIDVMLKTKVKRIVDFKNEFELKISGGRIRARSVVVSAGAHSLLFAQNLGYGLQYACLPVAGSFYYASDVLKGKVYTIQNDKLPFAAIHGDPDLLVGGKTRFGPTALVLPMLERHNYKTVSEFFKLFSLDMPVLKVMWDLFKVADIRNYMFKNMLFEVPYIRRRLFLKDARKIVPTLQLQDLTFAKRIGGIRPVMIDKTNHKLHLGEARINPGNGLIFNMTPSPGATSCLQNAEQDVRTLVDFLGCEFDEAKLNAELKK